MKSGLWPSALALLVLVSLPGSLAKAQGRERDTIVRSNMVIDEIVVKNKKGLPPSLLRKAYAVAIFPNIVKGGFIVGGRFGSGLVMVRDGEKWSYPIFASLGGGSFGLQAGIQSTDLVLVFKSRQSLDSFFKGEGKLTIGANGSLALGSMGRHAEAGTGVALKAQYVAYSRNRGLFAGASLAGTGLSIDWRSNAMFYGRTVTPGDIILRNNLTFPEDALPSVIALQATMTKKTQLGAMPDSDSKIIIDGAMDGEEIEIPHDEPVTLDGRPVRRSRPTQPKINSDDTPVDDGPDLLPSPPTGSSAVAPRTSTPATKPTTRPAKPPVDNSDLDFPPLEGPSAKRASSSSGSTPKRTRPTTPPPTVDPF